MFPFHVWNESFIYEINFRMWISHFICETHVSNTNISHVIFRTKVISDMNVIIDMWKRSFLICEMKFHI